jgi:hypothetical protein
MLQTSQRLLPVHSSDAVALFLVSDACETLCSIVKAKIANHAAEMINTSAEDATKVLQMTTVPDAAIADLRQMARFKIFLEVLEGLKAEIKTNTPTHITDKITID